MARTAASPDCLGHLHSELKRHVHCALEAEQRDPYLMRESGKAFWRQEYGNGASGMSVRGGLSQAFFAACFLTRAGCTLFSKSVFSI